MIGDDYCPVCGLPKDLCVCSDIDKEVSIVEIKTERRKYGKVYTLIIGLKGKKEDLKTIFKSLKSKLGCGGTINNGVIELQGEHIDDVKKRLIELGYSEDSIIITKEDRKKNYRH